MKCMSSCFSCLCGTKNSARVTPSDPLQIVQVNAVKHHSRFRRTAEEDNDSGGRINPNFTIGDGEDDPDGNQDEENSTVKALYIEVGKDRLLRVIHIRSIDEDDDESSPFSSRKGSVTGSVSPSDPNQASSPNVSDKSTEKKCKSPVEKGVGGDGDITASGGDDDEEEYWFSKWARKPRFRSIFAKNPENRPKLGGGVGESNNNMSQDESNKVTVELEMARAAAAAKRRAWAYNNNGNCDPTIIQHPEVIPGEEEEFNSIAIVNSSKQQWTKQVSPENNRSEDGKEDDQNKDESAGTLSSTPTSPSQVQVEVSVEKHSERRSSKEGISNPAFQEDEQGEHEKYDKRDENDKTENKNSEQIVNASKISSASTSINSTNGNQNSSGASVKSRSSSSSSSKGEEDEIIVAVENDAQKSTSSSPANSSKTATPTLPHGDSVLNVVPKKPILFFIHSLAGSSDLWHQQFNFFQQLGYEIVAPDLLGHGLSSTPLNPKYYYFESLVQDLILVFDHFCKDDENVKVVLIGHGYGACLAAMLTRVRLKNVALLISIAGGGPTPLVRRTCCQDSWLSWKCKLFHRNRIRGRFDNPELKHVLPATIRENILSGQVWPDGDSAFYRRITVPTLLTYGMRDKVVTLVEECEMERTIPKSFLELIDSAGHMVMLDAPEKLNKMLCKFIQSWS